MIAVGVFKPVGGGSGTATVEVKSCGKSITLNIDNFGQFEFEPFDSGSSPIMGRLRWGTGYNKAMIQGKAYKATKKPEVLPDVMYWFLDYTSPIEMFSVSGFDAPGVPPHEQFHHWAFLPSAKKK